QWQTLKPQSAPQSVRTSPPDVAKHVLVATSASARPCVVPQRLHAWLSTAPPATCTCRSSTTWLATPWLQLPPWKLMCAHWKTTRRLRHLRSAHSLLHVTRKPTSKPSSSTAQATSTTVGSQLLQTPLAKQASSSSSPRKPQRNQRLVSDREWREGGRYADTYNNRGGRGRRGGRRRQQDPESDKYLDRVVTIYLL